MTYYLTSVGTSLLTNGAVDALRQLLSKTANLIEEELSAEQRAAIDARIAVVREQLRSADVAARQIASAELNGLHKLLGPSLVGTSGDLHFLLATDTYQGQAAAGLLEEVLLADKAAVTTEVPAGLSTKDHRAFGRGIRALIGWCGKTFGTCRESRTRVVFNLVGSFKSLQGYLNTVGMVYADEIVYIFEGPDSGLVRIPRLPMSFDLTLLRQERSRFAMLETGEWTEPVAAFADWPEALWEEVGPGSDQGYLSDWGLLLWGSSEGEILNDGLLTLPRLDYSDQFRRDFENRRGNRVQRIELQRRLARVAALLEASGGDTSSLRSDPLLRYENYTKHKHIGHFYVNNDGWRASCVAEGGRLRMRRFGDHTVNDDP